MSKCQDREDCMKCIMDGPGGDCAPPCILGDAAACYACVRYKAPACVVKCGFKPLLSSTIAFLLEPSDEDLGTCKAHLHWFKCKMSEADCKNGATYDTYYKSSKAKCCCHCVKDSRTGDETC